MIGTKVAYWGKAFLPLALLFFTTQYFGINIPKVVKCILVGIHTVIFALVFSCEYHSLFYTSITYTEEGLFSHNIYGHGPIYNAYTALLTIYLLINFVLSLVVMLREKNRKLRIRMQLIMACVMISFSGLVIFLSGLSKGYDATSLAYLLCTFIMILAALKYDLLDALDKVTEYISDNLSVGIVAVNPYHQIIYSNQPAIRIFPNLEKDGMEVIDILKRHLTAESVIKKGEEVYRVKCTELRNEKKHLGELFIMDDITKEYVRSMKAQKMALTDGLTGFGNRRAYEQDMEKYSGKELDERFVYIAMDINGLKAVNDSLGHDAGDELILGAAECIKKSIGRDGKIYRIGGDEFIAILFLEEEKREEIRNRLLTIVGSWSGEKVKELALSLGQTSRKEFPDKTVAELAKMADMRMYEDKNEYYRRTGKDRRKVVIQAHS